MVFVIPVSVLIFAGCMEREKYEVVDGVPTIVAPYTSAPVAIDGKLEESIWQKAIGYELSFSADKGCLPPVEAGVVKIAWDENYLYLACEFMDSDVIAKGDEDQMHHYRFGDLCELFLKPADKPWYWELYVTPRGNKTTFFFTDRKCIESPSCFENYRSDLSVAAKIDGTLNKGHDNDNMWTGEMAMPVKDLTQRGDSFGIGSDWRIFVGRYNQSQSLPAKELSMFPRLSKTSFHLTDEYAKLILEK